MNVNPTFAQQYTDDSVTLNSVLVVCGDQSSYIDYYDIYPNALYASYYGGSNDSFDGEGLITSAIASLQNGQTSKLYYTSGHSELSLSSDMTTALDKAGFETASLNLLSEDIPEDTDVLTIFSPQVDFTEEEAQKVIEYLDNGGHAFIVSLFLSTDDMPNFNSILENYGCSLKSGYICEGDASAYSQAPYFILPTKNDSSTILNGLSSQNVIVPFGQAIEVSESSDDSDVTVNEIFTTSDSAYIKSLEASTIEKEDGDETGSFTMAVRIENESTGMELAYFTSPCIFSSSALSSLLQTSVSLPAGNTTLFGNTMAYLTNSEVSVSVEAKDMSLQYNTVSSSTGVMIFVVMSVIIPALMLVLSIVRWVRRRRR